MALLEVAEAGDTTGLAVDFFAGVSALTVAAPNIAKLARLTCAGLEIDWLNVAMLIEPVFCFAGALATTGLTTVLIVGLTTILTTALITGFATVTAGFLTTAFGAGALTTSAETAFLITAFTTGFATTLATAFTTAFATGLAITLAITLATTLTAGFATTILLTTALAGTDLTATLEGAALTTTFGFVMIYFLEVEHMGILTHIKQ